ncbi:unnamed protein product [Caenorhabditis sp. 36 PRJEB53466]|nr:unnamed protein product [Caenorhabditis sp. 36 PRJEB53466]
MRGVRSRTKCSRDSPPRSALPFRSVVTSFLSLFVIILHYIASIDDLENEAIGAIFFVLIILKQFAVVVAICEQGDKTTRTICFFVYEICGHNRHDSQNHCGYLRKLRKTEIACTSCLYNYLRDCQGCREFRPGGDVHRDARDAPISA